MLKIALAQINPIVGDIKGNTEKVLKFSELAYKKGADIAVFPEMCITGYPPEDLLFKRDFLLKASKALKRITKILPINAAIVGLPIKRKDKLYNAAAVISRSGEINMHFKNALPNYGVFDEKRYFVSGDDFLTFNHSGKEVLLSICEDIWEESSVKKITNKNADVVINISASPFYSMRIKERVRHITGLSKKFNSMLIYVNLVGGQDELIFDGGSIVANRGKLIKVLPQFQEKVGLVSVAARRSVSFMPMKKEEEVYKALKLALRDYVRKNGFASVVIGLSGGIDSALTCVIAADALGKDKVLALIMPSMFSSNETQRDAEELAMRLGVRWHRIEIHPIYENFLKSLKPVFGDAPFNVAEENIQARIRGTLLMAVSNKFGSLLITTGNKSEVSVGYCTLYGDMAGGFALLKDVPKTLVYRLAGYYNRISKKKIPDGIIKRAPSAELRANQKDEDSLMKYKDLDRLIEMYVEKHMPKKEVISTFKDKKQAMKMINLIDRSEYKRRQSPPGPKITPRAFGRDWRMPITKTP